MQISRFCFLVTIISQLFLIACGSSPGDARIESDATAQFDSGQSEDAAIGDDSNISLVPVCGDGKLAANEVCDDGNTESGDGCAANCATVEEGYACGEGLCVPLQTCGNARIEGTETCDDRNTQSGDGCSVTCQRENGWRCPVAGAACVAAECGDGIVAGFEVCDDGSASDGDGCSAACQLEAGYKCDASGCERTTCGDGVAEGTEDCDDGNKEIGDGCTPFCTREPNCNNGVCEASCGDQVIFAPETCDDGNQIDGDGCSSSCQVEQGYTCDEVQLEDPASIELPIVIRDFVASCGTGSRLAKGVSGAEAPYGHPDFECMNGAERGMVASDLVDGRPVRLDGATKITSKESFGLWYRSDESYNRTVVQRMTFGRTQAGTYRFESPTFFPLSHPIDTSAPAGLVEEGLERLHNDHNDDKRNFHFTSEVRFWFEYEGTETLRFDGDDDVWVFINGKLAVDIGGIHGRQTDSITLSDCDSANAAQNTEGCLSALDLKVGRIYEAVVFQAERHTERSQYELTLSNFNRAKSICSSTCGDGELANNEACDDGDENGASYNGCTAECTLAPFCGDGVVQDEHGEICDDGLNLGGGPSACAPGCQSLGARCGDGVVQTDSNEQCDDGNAVGGDGCSAACRFELR